MFSNYPNISYTNLCDKMSSKNSANPDQSAWSKSDLGLHCLLSFHQEFCKINTQTTKFVIKKILNKVFKILGHLL